MADQVRFQEAIDYLAGKVNLPTRRSDDLKHGAHVRGFSVAGVTRDDMLSDFRSAIEKARSEGTGYNDFRKDFDEIVKRYGWQYFSHGKTDEERAAWRSKIIFTTNMRTSYMAGRWKQMTDPDVMRYRPYLQYVHSGSLHPRKLHLSWDGRILRTDDPAWRYMFPPNGWGCFCDVEALSERDLKALGKSGPDQAPDLTPYEDTDPRTGQTEMRIPGIDRGWEYNVGQEWQHGMVPVELQQPLKPFGTPVQQKELPPLPRPATAEPEDILQPSLNADDQASAFAARFGLQNDEPAYYRDVSGGIVTIGKTMFRPTANLEMSEPLANNIGRYAVLLADAIQSPDEIWVDWAEAGNGIVLRRSYLKRVMLPDGRILLIRYQWTKLGWKASADFDTAPDDYRQGALIFRRDN